MDDEKIVNLFWQRSESAIRETEKKYAKYIHYIAERILCCREDAEECVNDTFLAAWNAIPPKRPERLSTFLGKIARNLALNRYNKQHTEKRGAGQTELILDELAECIPDSSSGEYFADDIALSDAISKFLYSLPEQTRNIFVRRYWYMSSNKEISSLYHISETNVSSSLGRTRNLLKEYLEKEGFYI